MHDQPILLLTRPQEGSERFAEKIRARFGDAMQIVIAPLQEIEWMDFETDWRTPQALIFTSQNGILGWNRDDSRPSLPAYCVGPQTSASARAEGHEAIECGGDAEALVAKILADNPRGPLLHICGEHSRGNIAERLSRAGIETQSRVAYRQKALSLSDTAEKALIGTKPIIAPLFSPRSVSLFCDALPVGASPFLAVISPNAAERVDVMLQRRMMVAENPDADGMLDAVAALFAAASQA